MHIHKLNKFRLVEPSVLFWAFDFNGITGHEWRELQKSASKNPVDGKKKKITEENLCAAAPSSEWVCKIVKLLRHFQADKCRRWIFVFSSAHYILDLDEHDSSYDATTASVRTTEKWHQQPQLHSHHFQCPYTTRQQQLHQENRFWR